MTSGLRESKEKKTLFEARVMPDEVVGASEAAVPRNLISPGGHGGGASGDSDPESDRGRRVQAASLAAGLADSEAGDAAWSDQPLAGSGSTPALRWPAGRPPAVPAAGGPGGEGGSRNCRTYVAGRCRTAHRILRLALRAALPWMALLHLALGLFRFSLGLFSQKKKQKNSS